MSTPPTIHDPSDQPLTDGNAADADWARWEQTFRDARPILPDAALARIEATIAREAQRAPETPSVRAGRWVLLLVVLLLAICGVGIYSLARPHFAKWFKTPVVEQAPTVAPRVRDRYALDVPIGPPSTAATHPASTPLARPQATVEAAAKSTQEGVTTYAGPVTLAAGPWRIDCDKLTVFRNPPGGVLLSAAGHIHLTGVPALQSATADESTLNTATGELKLAGKVHLERERASQDVDWVSITRTGDIHLPQP